MKNFKGTANQKHFYLKLTSQTIECLVCKLNSTICSFNPPFSVCRLQHIICHTCADGKNLCQLCKSPPLKKQLSFQQVLNRIFKVRCKNEGCTLKLTLPEVSKHKVTCKYKRIRCKLAACRSLVQPSRYDDHVRQCHADVKILTEEAVFCWDSSLSQDQTQLIFAYNQYFWVRIKNIGIRYCLAIQSVADENVSGKFTYTCFYGWDDTGFVRFTYPVTSGTKNLHRVLTDGECFMLNRGLVSKSRTDQNSGWRGVHIVMNKVKPSREVVLKHD